MTTLHSNGYRPPPRMVVVTAGTSAERLEHFADVLRLTSADPNNPPPIVAVLQTSRIAPRLYRGLIARSADYLGVVPAFAYGVHLAMQAYPLTEIIAVLHDDCIVQEQGWDSQVVDHFAQHPKCGLAGFGGAWGLGDDDIQTAPYRPTLLVRKGFMSNMKDAEAHGTRVTESRRIAVLDGFSLIFRRPFARQYWTWAEHSGIVHHCYDAAAGALAWEAGQETWLIPVACHHLGGQTAVGDGNYAVWARARRTDGDQTFWEEAHRIVYDRFKHILPIRV